MINCILCSLETTFCPHKRQVPAEAWRKKLSTGLAMSAFFCFSTKKPPLTIQREPATSTKAKLRLLFQKRLSLMLSIRYSLFFSRFSFSSWYLVVFKIFKCYLLRKYQVNTLIYLGFTI